MPLASGTHLGPYEITAPLGAGGMGEVYRARDTRLERTVAIKILPEQLSNDPVRKQRFEREAKTISNLNHPHICVLYDVGHQDGIDYLVMECVEGETLGKRLEKGALPLEQVLKFGTQIADALDKAHRSGVVHRDLKPGNIMLTPTGAKLLDFGLAKPAAPMASVATLTAAVTQSSPMTEQGAIVGTFQYMSPEQIEAKELDGRSDIFSLGAVLYEMLTGQRAFQGKSQLSVASAILEKEPVPISTVKPMTPPTLDHAIRRCLAKEPEKRWQSAADLAGELQWIAEAGSQTAVPFPVVSRRSAREGIAWAAAATAGLLAVFFGIGYLRHPPSEARTVRAFILSPEKAKFAPVGIEGGPVTISPDGRHLAFAAKDESGKQLLWIRPLDSVAAQPLSGTEGASYPFWSPDSRFVGFFAGGKLKKIAVSGGLVQSLCDAPEGRGGTWNEEGVILFAPSIRNALSRVQDSGGTPAPATKLDESQPGASHRWPSFLPDGHHFLFFARGNTPGIYSGALDSQETKLLLQSEANAAYSSSGYLLWWREGTLMAQPLDTKHVELTGNAVPLADHVLYSYGQSVGVFSISQNGILAYQSGETLGASQLSWFDRSGKQLGKIGEQDFLAHPRISPNGERIAVNIANVSGTQRDIWLYELARGVRTRFTLSQSADYAVWSPDGSRIVFSSGYRDRPGLFVKSPSGTGGEQLLLDTPGVEVPWSWSPDGRYIAYMQHGPMQVVDKFSIWILPLFGDRKPFPFLESEYNRGAPTFSPDGRWIAYQSNESGAAEIYVAAFPSATTNLQVSTAGGVAPVWRPDGKELFYLTRGGQLMAVSVSSSGSGLKLETPHALFQTGILLLAGPLGLGTQPFDVSGNGERFVIAAYGDVTPTPITVVLNWDAELKKK
jgi:eukaryotic-like serine/threonine-protein kinase